MARLGALGKRSANQVLMEKQVRRFDSGSGESETLHKQISDCDKQVTG